MLLQLVFAFGLTCATVIIHAIGTSAAIVRLARDWQKRKSNQRRFTAGIQIVRLVAVLLLLHLIEAVGWAGLYLASGDLPDFEAAIYFSMTSYTTVGYGDLVLPAPWRILGPLEAGVGILMFGWSTAIIVAAVTRIYGSRLLLREGLQ